MIFFTASLMFLLFPWNLSHAQRCSRCADPPTSGAGCDINDDYININDCNDCLEHGEEICNTNVILCDGFGYPSSSVFPYHDYCEWRNETGRDLGLSKPELFLNCTEWEQYGEDNDIDIIDIVNRNGQIYPIEFKCYHCDQPCTRVYTCDDTSYVCNNLFDVAIIQFNAAVDSSCSSLFPVGEGICSSCSSHDYEYCDSPYPTWFSIDCGGLCDIEDDNDLNGFICPNGKPVNEYWTLCSDNQAGEFARRIFEDDIPDGLKADLNDNTNLLPPLGSFYSGGRYSCVDFGEVGCEKGEGRIVWGSDCSNSGGSSSDGNSDGYLLLSEGGSLRK